MINHTGNNKLYNTGEIRLGRPRSRWDETIRVDLSDVGINTRN